MEKRKYARSARSIDNTDDWKRNEKGYYVDFHFPFSNVSHTWYFDIVKESDNLLDLIDELRYTAYSPLFKTEIPHCRCYYYKDNDTHKEGVFIADYLTKKELNEFELPTVKGYIWAEGDLICVAEMKEINGKYELVLKY